MTSNADANTNTESDTPVDAPSAPSSLAPGPEQEPEPVPVPSPAASEQAPSNVVRWLETLVLATNSGKMQLVDYLLAQPDAAATRDHYVGRGVLMMLCGVVDTERTLAQLLPRVFAAGWSSGEADSKGWTLLHCAARLGSKRLVPLLGARPEVDLNAQKEDGFSALHLAVVNGHIGVVDELFEAAHKRGVELRAGAFAKDGKHALHLARSSCMLACLLSRYCFRALVNAPAAVRIVLDTPTPPSDYPLHAALANGDDVVVRVSLLLAAGADASACGSGGAGDTIVGRVAKRRMPWAGRLVDLVLRHVERTSGLDALAEIISAPTGPALNTPLHAAVKADNKRVVRALMRFGGGRLDALDAYGWSALALAEQRGATKIAALLRANGAGATRGAEAPTDNAGGRCACGTIHGTMSIGGMVGGVPETLDELSGGCGGIAEFLKMLSMMGSSSGGDSNDERAEARAASGG